MTISQREDKVIQLEELKAKQEILKEEVERLRQEKETAEEPEKAAKEEHKKVIWQYYGGWSSKACHFHFQFPVLPPIRYVCGVIVYLEVGGRGRGKEGCPARGGSKSSI